MSKNCYENPEAGYRDEYMDAAMQVRDCFCLLWLQHVYWTRMVITGIAFDSPDLEATTARLLRNPADFARVFRHFYGTKISSEFKRLLTAHLVIAAELVKAAKAGNSKAAANAEKRWYENADEIACFLHDINPYWTVKHMKAMWHEHLALTKQEAVEQLNGNYAQSIATFNKIEKQALEMADTFSTGIIHQFNL